LQAAQKPQGFELEQIVKWDWGLAAHAPIRQNGFLQLPWDVKML